MRQTRRVEPRDGESQPYGARAPESVEFESARVTGSRRRPPIFAIGFVALVGGMAAIGLAGREPAGTPAVLGSPILRETPDRGVAASGAPLVPVGPATRPSPDSAPVVTNGEGPIVIQGRRHPETLYVHGDVFVESVTWVFVSLQYEAGRIAGWASVSVPGAAGPAPSDGPTLRFDVEMALPVEAEGRDVSIHVSAHDVEGRLVATAKIDIGADGYAVTEHGAATPTSGRARPGVFFPLLDATWEDVR